MAGTDTFLLSNTTKGTLPSVPFVAIKDAILGKRYTLSLTFIGTRRSHTLNLGYRGKDRPTNVLSFPLGDDMGEIYITPVLLPRQAREFDMNEKEYLAYLFIHGCLHLKGFAHGAEMEKAETRYLKKFNILT